MPYEPMSHVQVRMRIQGRGDDYVACQVSAAGGRTLQVVVPRGQGGLPWVPEGTSVEFLQRDGLHRAGGRVRARSLRPVPSYAVELDEPVLSKILFTPKEGRAILVTGGKGGTGKTFVSTSLALLLAKQGARVALFDADLGTADVAVNLGLPREPNLGHILDGKKTIEDVLQRDVRPNLSVLPGALGTRFSDPSAWKLGAILTLVQKLRSEHDFVVIDSRAGIGNDVTTLFAGVDNVLFVTADEPAALSDTLELLQGFGAIGRGRAGAFVVNRVHSYRNSVDRLLQFRAKALEATGADVQLWGVLQEDPRVHALAQDGKLLLDEFPLAPTSVALRQLAARLQAV